MQEESAEQPDAKRARLSDAAQASASNEAVPADLTAPQYRRWKAGMFTLLIDEKPTDDVVLPPWCLDVLLHIGGYGFGGATHWDPAWNGQTIYVGRDDNEEVWYMLF